MRPGVEFDSLLARVCADDPQAAQELYERHRRVVKGVSRSCLLLQRTLVLCRQHVCQYEDRRERRDASSIRAVALNSAPGTEQTVTQRDALETEFSALRLKTYAKAHRNPSQVHF